MIAQEQVVVTAADRERLRRMIESLRDSFPTAGDPLESFLRSLEDHLRNASVVPENTVEDDVVTMNSRVGVRQPDTGAAQVFTLVYDGDADPFGDKLSVVTPLGTAVLGSRVGDVIEWQARRGSRGYRIEEILFQPEAAGDYGL